MNYTDIQQNTPRLVVEFRPEQDRFGWGIVGQMPILTVVGFLARVQSDLFFRTPPECPEMALVVVWDAETKTFDYFVHPAIPVDPLVGMLDAIKMSLIESQFAKPQNGIGLFGADGKPLLRR